MKINLPTYGVAVAEERARELWEIILKFPLPFDHVYLKYKYNWTKEFSEKAMEEYKCFIFLAYITEKEVTPSETVDEVWHCHILHTQSYKEFAMRCGYFVHHNPGMPSDRVRWNKQYLRTYRLYAQVFGRTQPLSHWPFKGGEIKLEVNSVPLKKVLEQLSPAS